MQSSKERYLQHKEAMKTYAKSQGRSAPKSTLAGKGKKNKDSAKKKERTFMEKLVLFLLVAFVVAIPFALVIDTNIMIYDGIINFLVLGLVTATKPQMVIEIMQKNNPKFDQIYGGKIKGLALFIRAFGLIFVIMGGYFIFYLLY